MPQCNANRNPARPGFCPKSVRASTQITAVVTGVALALAELETGDPRGTRRVRFVPHPWPPCRAPPV
eukprot:3183406-Prymnesium_polylepis.1